MQNAVFDAAENTDRSITVVARAGSGKTTTLGEVARRLPRRDKMGIVAFANRSRERVEDAKPPKHFSISTLHSLGLSILRQKNPWLVVDNKGDKLERILRNEVRADLREAVSSLVKRAKTRLVEDAKSLAQLAAMSADFEAIGTRGDEVVEAAQRVLFMCREEDGVVDFDDMIWLPVVLEMHGGTYDTLLVDELQDLTRAQVRLVAMLVENGGRAIGFGDPAQAIYQFAGADVDAVAALEEMTDAVRLPLSISYRCPRSVIALARRFVPDIEPHPSAPAGKVCYVSRETESGLRYIAERVRGNDLVLSRTNAPLLSVALEFARRHAPAQIVGRRIDKEMLTTIDRSGAGSVAGLLRWLDDWSAQEVTRLRAERLPTDRVEDRVASFAAVCRGAQSLHEVRGRIIQLFMPKPGASIRLSTVHQMKGEEAENVFVLRDTFRVRDDDPKPGSEETNLLYVAITRAKHTLHMVEGVT